VARHRRASKSSTIRGPTVGSLLVAQLNSDIITGAKGLANGSPIGLTVARPEVADGLKGVTIRPIYPMTGDHHFNEVQMTDVFVPDDMVVGEIGNGWQQVTAELAFERSGPERFLSTLPVLRAGAARMNETGYDDTAAIEVGALVMRLAALRTMSLGVAAALDRHEAPAVQAAMVKDAGTRYESQVTDTMRRLTGVAARPGGDALEEMLAEAIVHAPGFTLRGGTNEVLRGVIARELGLR